MLEPLAEIAPELVDPVTGRPSRTGLLGAANRRRTHARRVAAELKPAEPGRARARKVYDAAQWADGSAGCGRRGWTRSPLTQGCGSRPPSARARSAVACESGDTDTPFSGVDTIAYGPSWLRRALRLRHGATGRFNRNAQAFLEDRVDRRHEDQRDERRGGQAADDDARQRRLQLGALADAERHRHQAEDRASAWS